MVEHAYPCPTSADDLKRYCIILRVQDDAATVGYVWSTWHREFPKTLQFHVCIAPSHRGRWLDCRVMRELEKISLLVGADMITAALPFDSKRISALMVRFYGFHVEPLSGEIFKPIED